MQDLRSAFRNLARSPGFAILAIVTLAVGIGLPIARAAAPDDHVIVQAVLAANKRLNASASRLDTDAFFAGIVDSDETRIIQDGRLFKTRAEAIAAVRAGSQGVAKVGRRFEDPHATVPAPGVALLTAEGATIATLEDGRGVSSRFAVSLVFVHRDGWWLLFHGHYSIPNAAP